MVDLLFARLIGFATKFVSVTIVVVVVVTRVPMVFCLRELAYAFMMD